jgi:hypothetical protein
VVSWKLETSEDLVQGYGFHALTMPADAIGGRSGGDVLNVYSGHWFCARYGGTKVLAKTKFAPKKNAELGGLDENPENSSSAAETTRYENLLS